MLGLRLKRIRSRIESQSMKSSLCCLDDDNVGEAIVDFAENFADDTSFSILVEMFRLRQSTNLMMIITRLIKNESLVFIRILCSDSIVLEKGKNIFFSQWNNQFFDLYQRNERRSK